MKKNHNKKLLIISNNPLSNIQNNGKTLVSLIDEFDSKNIYQVYFNSALPDYSKDCHYFQITEKSIMNSLFNKEKCGQIVTSQEFKNNSFSQHKNEILKKSNVIRLFRELIWKTKKWKNNKLKEWVYQNRYDAIIFMAGDCLFAYDICEYIYSLTHVRLTTFITDDYILGKTSNIVSNIRKRMIQSKMESILKISDVFLTISDEMSKQYEVIFNKKSLVFRNYTKGGNISNNINNNDHEHIVLTYAGGFHYNRWKVLAFLGKIVDDYNMSNDKKAVLNIYSSQSLSNEIEEAFSSHKSINFCGCVNKEELSKVYSDSDILVHVESFDKKSINSTKLSFSTKIPEYLSMKKCILAIGPDSIASMKFLDGIAYCINDLEKSVNEEIELLISDKSYREKIANRCYNSFEKFFSAKGKEKIINEILGDKNERL